MFLFFSYFIFKESGCEISFELLCWTKFVCVCCFSWLMKLRVRYRLSSNCWVNNHGSGQILRQMCVYVCVFPSVSQYQLLWGLWLTLLREWNTSAAEISYIETLQHGTACKTFFLFDWYRLWKMISCSSFLFLQSITVKFSCKMNVLEVWLHAGCSWFKEIHWLIWEGVADGCGKGQKKSNK